MSQNIDQATVPAQAQGVRTARHWLMERIGDDHPAAPDATVLVSEAVTNGVCHGSRPEGGSQVTVGYELTEHLLIVEVVDDGCGGEPHLVDHSDPCAENGRGLRIMAELAEDWGYERLADGRGRFRFTLAF
jgi:anti-sigma regulatory factor (Ser/Thr protein kinase)